MAKTTSQVFIFGDSSWPVESVARGLEAAGHPEGSVFWIKHEASSIQKKIDENLSNLNKSQSPSAIAIVGFKDPVASREIVQKIRSRDQSIRILQLASEEVEELSQGEAPKLTKPSQRTVAWQELFRDRVETEIELLELQQKVKALRDLAGDAKSVALLLQDDPDPDGLASALALRKVLGRNSQSAPIVSFGSITRPENVAMARLLEIDLEKVHEVEDLGKFDRIIMVDCQPSFFRGRVFDVDAIVDHHPKSNLVIDAESRLKFCEVREDLGSTSTLVTLYLRALNIEVSQRLATALLYGIKSDTLALNRQVSESDLEAFRYLYPHINGNMLRKIERPELPTAFVERLRKSLRNLKIEKGLVVLSLGVVDREEWIPQAADFGLQMEGAEWSLGCGIFEGKVIVSLRNCGYVQHGGELIKDLFSKLGSAGGHRCMAKAIVPKSDWEKKFGATSSTAAGISRVLRRLFNKNIQVKSAGN